MIITVEEIKKLKEIPNSGYEHIKVEFLFHSNKLEGSTFTRENLERYLKENIVEGSHDVDDVFETINSTELFDFVVETLDEPISVRLLHEFHQLLKKNTKDQARGFVGGWKKIPNMILGVQGQLDLAQPFEVPLRIDALLQDWNAREKDFDAIMKFHTEFEKIHPYQDGNASLTKMKRNVESLVETDNHNFSAKNEQYRSHDGRVGRFLMFKQCVENSVDLISIDEKYSDEYKQGLFIAQTTGDF